jgi:hypothetical protein
MTGTISSAEGQSRWRNGRAGTSPNDTHNAEKVRVVAEALEAYHNANYRGHDLVYWSTWEQFATIAVEALGRLNDGSDRG